LSIVLTRIGQASSVGEIKPESLCTKRSQMCSGSSRKKQWLVGMAVGRVRRVGFLVLKDMYTVLQQEVGEVQ